MEHWKDHYRERLISAEEAANMVKSGDNIAFTRGREAFAVGMAIACRKDELKGVKVYVHAPGYDLGWYEPGWEDSFSITVGAATALCQEAIDEGRVDIQIYGLIPYQEPRDAEPPDILITEISPPDELGFCSFGSSLWDKKRQIAKAKLVIAEVNKNLIRTFGDNFINVSEIDYFVEHVETGGKPGAGSLAGRALKETEPYIKDITGYVSQLIKDRDTIQIGVGRTTEPMVNCGLLDGKHDIGFHSEGTPPGIISLVKQGVITGKYKTINQGKVVVTTIGGSTREELQWVHENPLFHLVDVEYLEDIRVVAAHDNFVAINNALIVDLTGQIGAETLGTHMLSLAGGQIPFAVGASLSKGGRSITVLPSTARSGTVSRIVPVLPPGTVMTVHRNCADYIVTEYGIANIGCRTLRERVEALINIAHPDFRQELRKEAQKLLYIR